MIRQTKTDAPPQLAGGGLSWLAGLPEWLRSNLFRQSSSGRPTWRHILAGVLFIIGGAAVSLARTSGPGALNSTWIEDAGNFLQDGLHQSVLTTLTTQMNGYYDVVPRAITVPLGAAMLTTSPAANSPLTPVTPAARRLVPRSRSAAAAPALTCSVPTGR